LKSLAMQIGRHHGSLPLTLSHHPLHLWNIVQSQASYRANAVM
jgi:hypothetical protein